MSRSGMGISRQHEVAMTYQVVCSPRRTTVSLQVSREGVTVRCPTGIPLAKVEALVFEHRDWIRRKQAELAERPLPLPRTFADGEMFLYLGDPLQLQRDPAGAAIRREAGILLVPNGEAHVVKALISEWYVAQAQVVIPQRVEHYRHQLGVGMPPVLIRNPRKRWGSCNTKGELRFNWRIMMAPLQVLDYVVVHELCHLRHLNHSRQFWACVGSLLPDYQDRKHLLKQISHRLDL
ncbi:MAG: M48 family metallopeptidase [Synechococcaceae cyanobacterium RM1_1_27]|nr:M48 family metallopeptidase [Synechococcaceae cyanobacterium RM1_1_27]